MIQCPICGAENESGREFCEKCAAYLPQETRSEPDSKLDLPALTPEIREKAMEVIQHKTVEEKGRMVSNSNKAVRIGVWGPTGAGKTTYIVSVWGACLNKAAQWRVRPDDPQTTDFISNRLALLRRPPGRFPEPTMRQPEPVYYNYYFLPGKPERNQDGLGPLDRFWDWIISTDSSSSTSVKGRELNVSFADVAGQQYIEDPLDSPLWENIVGCRGLLCLLDPENAEKHFEITLRLMQNLWLKAREKAFPMENGMLPHYLALCFTKMDMKGLIPYMNKPELLLDDLGRKTGIHLDQLLGGYFSDNHISFHTISSIGVDENGQSLVDSNGEIPHPEKIRPINVLQPLKWFFEVMQR